MSQPDNAPGHDPEEPAEPRNRAERRAQRKGKKVAPAPGHGPVPQGGRQQPMLPPRRAGRRGNR